MIIRALLLAPFIFLLRQLDWLVNKALDKLYRAKKTNKQKDIEEKIWEGIISGESLR